MRYFSKEDKEQIKHCLIARGFHDTESHENCIEFLNGINKHLKLNFINFIGFVLKEKGYDDKVKYKEHVLDLFHKFYPVNRTRPKYYHLWLNMITEFVFNKEIGVHEAV